MNGWVVLVSLLALHVANPYAWGLSAPFLWFPAAGVALCLVAWFGRRAVALVLLDGLLVAAQGVFLEYFWPGGRSSTALALAGADAVLGAAEILVAWSVYHSLARGARTPGDPRSATLFLVLVPGLTLGLFAVARTGLFRLGGEMPGTFGNNLVWFWFGRALGVVAVAPALLAALTPRLVRRGLTVDEPFDRNQAAGGDHVGAERVGRYDWLEMGVVAAVAAVLSLVLASPWGRTTLAGWQLGSLPLLLILWAGARQGVRGGCVVAAAAAALPLLVLADLPLGGDFTLRLQATLLAQCGAALLVAASSRWIRFHEARYRQVVGHIPVVIYSARIRTPGRDGAPPAAEITLVSAASRLLLGCQPDELLGDYAHWLERVHPGDREVLVAAVAQLARQNEPVVCEYRLNEPEPLPLDSSALPAAPTFGLLPRRPSYHWLRDTLAPRRDGTGRCVGWEGVVVDVTEQRALADDLRRTTSLFNSLVANLPAGVVFVQGRRGRPLLVNARARELLGRREDAAADLEHICQTYHLHLPDGTPFPVEELPVVVALRRGHSTMRDDVVVHRPDGHRVPLVTWGAPVDLGPAPEAVAAVWVLEDLTELRQAEAARRDTEIRLRTIVETMGEGLLVLDRNGVVVDCNPAMQGLFGLGPEQLRGTFWAKFLHSVVREDGSPLPPEEYPTRTALRTGRAARNQVLGLRGAGQDHAAAAPHWLLVNVMPLGDGSEPAGVVATFSDITGYRQAQDGVRASEAKYRGLIDQLPCMLIHTDLEQRIRYINPATEAVTGYRLDEITEVAAWAAAIHPDDLGPVSGLARDALEGKAGRLEFRYKAKDGTAKVGFALAQPTWDDGRVTGVTTTIVDVTRQRLLEEKLQRVQRLELMGRLASGIAHDFNNLLNIVMQLTALARDTLPPHHPAYEDLERITEVSEQAAQLTAQLLAISKQRPIELRPLELNGHVRRALKILRSTLPGRIDLDARLAECDLVVTADESQVQQLVMNLCLNARDAMPNGGRLRVETGPGCPAGAAGAWAHLVVQDEGQGMTDKVKARIFDPFFSGKDRGTGLGLTIVQQVVEGFGGRIEVTSQPDQGARFDIWLPRAATDAGVDHEQREPTAAGGVNA